jgi:hypothetical protein
MRTRALDSRSQTRDRANVSASISPASSAELITPDEAARVRDVVYRLRSRWVERCPDSSYTLGAASYLDCALGVEYYRERAAATDPLLRSELGWLYDRLLTHLGQHLGRVKWSELSLPGFHIFVGAGDFVGTQQDNLHWDWSFLSLPWNPPLRGRWRLDRFVSFTLPIALPRAGSGLEMWPSMCSPDVVELAAAAGQVDAPTMRALLNDGRTLRRPAEHFVPYSVGELVMHSGHIVHAIPQFDKLEPDDERITLQGHALLHRGAWRVFW